MISRTPWKIEDSAKIISADGDIVAEDYTFKNMDDFEALPKFVNQGAESGQLDTIVRAQKTLEFIEEWAGIDGGHHKQWLIDQLVRILTGDNYDKWVAEWENGEDGAHTYEWDTGIAP